MSKARKIKKIISAITLTSLGIVLGSSLSISNLPNSISKIEISNNNSSGTTTTSQNNSYTVVSGVQPTNKYADQITNQELQSVLQSTNSSITFTVVILPVTETNINQGSVDFLIYQRESKGTGSYDVSFADATKSETTGSGSKATGAQSDNQISTDVLNKYKIDTGTTGTSTTAEQKNVFNSLKFSSLSDWILKKEFEIKWKSDTEISKYIKNKTTKGLTSEDVWLNMVEKDFLPPLGDSSSQGPHTEITVTEKTEIDSNKQIGNVGFYTIKIDIKGTTQSGKVKETTSTKEFGGFLTESNQRFNFEFTGNSNIGNLTIEKENLFNKGNLAAKTGTKLSELTPSEFASPNGGTQMLIKILTQNEGLSNNNGNKIFTLSFGNLKNIEFNKPTSSTKAITADAKITNIDTIPNDSNGSLQMVVYYEAFDVYEGKNKSNVVTYNFPVGTFRSDTAADATLFINWKTVDALPNMNYSNEVVNEYYKNKDDKEFARIFSNRFLDTTEQVKAMEREVSIEYEGIQGSETNGQYTSTSDSIIVTLTFPDWGAQGNSFKISNVFKFKGSTYDNTTSSNDALTFQWKSNKQLFDENRTFSEIQPSQIALELIQKNSNGANNALYSTFALGNSGQNAEVTILPNDADGTMMVYMRNKTDAGAGIVSASTHLYQQMYVGFKKVNNSGNVTSFAWIPQNQIDQQLLAIPVDQITKQNVIDLYLSKTDLFKDRVLTEDNVIIYPQQDESGTQTLVVEVTFPMYNQSIPGIDIEKQTFMTVIKGFSVINNNNVGEIVPPKDLTAIVSITSALCISIALGTWLGALLIRRARVKTFIKKEKVKKAKIKK